MHSNFTHFKAEIESLISISEDKYSENTDSKNILYAFPNISSSNPIGLYLIYAVLKGEHFFDFETQKNETSSLISDISPQIVKLKKFHTGIAQSHQDILEMSIKALKIYKSLLEISENSLNGQHQKIGINFIDDLRKREILWSNESTDTNSLFLLFTISITLAEIDMFLDCSINTRLQLKTIIKYLETNQLAILFNDGREIVDIIKEKATYLLDKIELRLLKRDKNKRSSLIIEYQQKVSKMNFFGSFMKQTISHYLEDESGNRFTNYCNSLNGLAEVHSKNKALRRGIALHQNIDTDISHLQQKLKIENQHPFDKWSYQSAVCLLENTILFRGLVNDEQKIIEELVCNSKSETLQIHLNKIKLNHQTKGILDYHSYKKFLDFLDNLTDKLRDFPVKILNKDWKKIETDKDRDDEIQSINKRAEEIKKIVIV